MWACNCVCMTSWEATVVHVGVCFILLALSVTGQSCGLIQSSIKTLFAHVVPCFKWLRGLSCVRECVALFHGKLALLPAC